MCVKYVYQMPLLNIDPLIKLGSVEKIFAKLFPDRPPSRPTIIGWIEEGLLDGRQIGRGENWFVYQSSLDNFILRNQPARQQKLAA